MKNIFIGLAMFTGIYSFAQEAGKAGELLKNEASVTEMKSSAAKGNQQNNTTKNNTTKSNSGFRNGNQNNGFKNPNYHWNQNYGYAEVFLRIPELGYFTVELGDQSISNNSGKYRFFDLQSGRMPISIYDNGFLIYRSTLMLRNNNRMVLDFFTNEGLYLLDSYPVQDGSYGFNDWNDIWNNPYGNQSGNWNQPGNTMDARTFSQFFEMLQNNEKFDDGKIALINQQMRTSFFTSQQIRDLVKSLSFDKNKLTLAKSMYRKCADKNRYFMVYDAFDFESSKRELMEYIANS
ncbi:DUF4476 domain-containing protein [Chryseobacterium sp. PTM-20240506]|uniref:DUF4476 domain-containing protein n=1 Tax=unclassified Chryseobacterium TaxID=2593645 RepID=UPI00235893E2|nr:MULTISPECIES: DUF4476 domain-containing protein [unclassified Chryseobacterium]MDC8104277.1 DUF4476 domain-containing protein [Chryseobacterium sp. B21-037]MDQ1803887.1 DUF4476 domain-containing protein [Chryseobacterium sp. CKR4-1]